MQTPSDLSAREQALTADKSFIVQAPAGSGKTELLIQRFLTLLAHSENPEEILAITFTRKAAAEMRERIVDALEKAKQAEPSESHAQKTWHLARAVLAKNEEKKWNLVENPNRLRIQTIDALCANLVRQMPLLSRFGSTLQIHNHPERLYEEAAEQVLLGLNDEDSWTKELADLLLHLDNDYSKTRKLLCDMLTKRDQWLPYLALTQHDEKKQRRLLEDNLNQVITETLQQAISLIPYHLKEETLALMRFAASHLLNTNSLIKHWLDREHFPEANPSEKNTWLGLCELLITQLGTWRKSINKNSGFPADKQYADYKKRAADLIQQLSDVPHLLELLNDIRLLPPEHYTDTQWKTLQALLTVLPVLAAHLQVIFQKNSAIDFIEMSQAALQALGDHENPTDLSLLLDYQIKHLLVDEFQDTSFSQMRLLEHLTAGWQTGDGRTLFLVGDPMQSIYRFRKAEVGLFLQAKHRGIGHVQLTPLTLRVNFRSTENIVQWVNKAFKQLMPSQEEVRRGAISFSDSTAFKPSNENSDIIFYRIQDTHENTEAKIIVDIIKSNKNIAESTAILVRSRSHLKKILPTLAAAGIPYRAIEIETLSHYSVIQDLLALTRALANLSDRIAWLSVLRSPCIGLTLTELHQIAAPDSNALIWERLYLMDTLHLSEQTKDRLQQFKNIFSWAIENRGRVSLAEKVETVWLSLNGPSALNDKNELKLTQTFFKLLREHTDLNLFQKELERLYAEAETNTDHPIEVMTIHKSKGLEFDHVILPGLERQMKNDDAQLLLSMETPSLFLAPIKASDSDDDPIYQYLREEEKKKADYELIRLLYVAATRAKKTLHWMGKIDTDELPKGGLLDRLWPAFQDTKTEIISDTVATPEEIIEKKHATIKRVKTITPFLHEKQENLALQQVLSTPLKDKILNAIGTITHRLLQHLAEDKKLAWEEKHEQYARYQLNSLNMTADENHAALSKIKLAIENTLNDEKGKWILSDHLETAAEYPLTAKIDGKFISVIIDRTFVDKNNIRWIIDYKTTEHPGVVTNEWIAQEVERHRLQLELYAKIMAMKESREIRLGLYFPALPFFCVV